MPVFCLGFFATALFAIARSMSEVGPFFLDVKEFSRLLIEPGGGVLGLDTLDALDNLDFTDLLIAFLNGVQGTGCWAAADLGISSAAG